jgi:hypothetical protein
LVCIIGYGESVSKHSPTFTRAFASRAHRWQQQQESGQYACLEDLAAANGVDRTYVGRILRLTSLAPEIVERILTGDESEVSAESAGDVEGAGVGG